MANILAPTTFATGQDEKLAAVDVYTQATATAPIDDSVRLLSSATDDMMSLTGTDAVAALDQIKDVPTSAANELTSSDMVKGVIAEDPGLQSAYASLDTPLQRFLTNAKGFANVSISNKGIKANLKLSSLSNVAGITAMVNIVGGKRNPFTVVDIAGQTNFLSNLLKVSAKLGVPNAYATVTANIGDPRILHSVTKNVLGTVIATSNVNMLSDIAKGSLSVNVRAMMPKFCSSFAANFKIPLGTGAGDYANIGASIASSFSRINPKWNISVSTRGRSMLNGNVSLNSSGDFRAVLRASSARHGAALFNIRTSAAFGGTTIPENNRPGVIKYETLDSAGRPVVRYKLPDGSGKRYYTEGPTDTLMEETTTPQSVPTDPASFHAFDNSGIDDPLTLAHIVSDSASQSSSRSADAAPLSCNAADSLRSYFPLTELGGMQNQDDEFFA